MSRRRGVGIAVVALVLAAAACAKSATPVATTAAAMKTHLPQGSEVVKIDPSTFTTTIDNPWWPMTVGNHWVFRELDSEGGDRRVDVTVTDKTKTLANGVEVRVVHDAVTDRKSGAPV